MKNLTLGDLHLGLEDLLDKTKPRLAILGSTTTGKLYIPILQRKLNALSSLPESRDPKRALTEELEKADQNHDGFGGAFWDLTGAYLRAPDTPEELRKTLLTLRDTFLSGGLNELRASHADEATRAKERLKKLDEHKASLQSIPLIGGKTLYDWVKAYLESGARLDDLMSERTFTEASQNEGSRASAGPLRGETLGSLYTMRSALQDERKEDSSLPENLDALLFGYFDELQNKRALQLPSKAEPKVELTLEPTEPSHN